MSANTSPTVRFLYRFADLEAQGWKVEHVDPRWGSVLCMKLEDGAADIFLRRAESANSTGRIPDSKLEESMP